MSEMRWRCFLLKACDSGGRFVHFTKQLLMNGSGFGRVSVDVCQVELWPASIFVNNLFYLFSSRKTKKNITVVCSCVLQQPLVHVQFEDRSHLLDSADCHCVKRYLCVFCHCPCDFVCVLFFSTYFFVALLMNSIADTERTHACMQL